MLKNISNLDGVTSLKKEQQLQIHGGMASPCIRACRQDFADCREDGHSHCAASLSICQASC